MSIIAKSRWSVNPAASNTIINRSGTECRSTSTGLFSYIYCFRFLRIFIRRCFKIAYRVLRVL